MSGGTPVRLADLTGRADRAAALAALEEVFFLSSARGDFPSPAARAAFLDTWTSWYVTRAPADVWLWRDADGGFAGYLTGCRDSAASTALASRIPGYAVFADLFDRFPAHLHVNVHPGHRGQGIGAALIGTFVADCQTGVPMVSGVHVVTGIGARNAGFYRRNGFTVAHERAPRLFLGRQLGTMLTS
jgi:GNAT superfamily N-acetyltransferase